MSSCWNDNHIAGVHGLAGGSGGVKVVTYCDVKWTTGNDCGMFIDGVDMRADSIIRHIFKADTEFSCLARVAVETKHLAASGHAGAIDPFA